MGDLVTRHGAKMTIACFAVFMLNIILYLAIGEFKLATIQSPGAEVGGGGADTGCETTEVIQ